MDLIAHGLWSSGLFKVLNRKKKKYNVLLASFWGIFPDLFAFTILIVSLFYNFIFNGITQKIAAGNLEPVRNIPLTNITSFLYSISHSFVIFLIVFVFAFMFFKRPMWELFGWLFHILIDIPSHSYAFYPTPFLWPVSNFKVDGYSWASPAFMLVNYSLLVIFYIYLIFFMKKKK